MKYILSIDWLSLTCLGYWGLDSLESINARELMPITSDMTINRLPHGSRQFKYIDEVVYNGKLFATIQSTPYSTDILPPNMVIIKLANYWLYRIDGIEMLDKFITLNNWSVNNINRLDIAADMDRFLHFKCDKFISDYAAGVYRHIGRSQGCMHFIQKGLNAITYNGLKFGNNESDCTIYLYDKTLELDTVKDKPYIRDKWARAGLYGRVWRLEVSIRSKAMHYKLKENGKDVTITFDLIKSMGQIQKIYFAFLGNLWQFIVFREDIKNVTREKRLEFFNTSLKLTRWVVRDNITAHTLSDKIAIKRLHTSVDNYKNGDLVQDEGATRLIAQEIAESTNLMDWYIRKKVDWEKKV